MDEATTRIIEDSENHFVDNILNAIIKTYSDFTPEEYCYDVSTMRGITLNKLQKAGFVRLPRADNFFFPQEVYINSLQGFIPLEYMHAIMPSISISHVLNGYLYTSTKLANVNISYEKSNVFVSSTKFIRNIIEKDKNFIIPQHLCYMYYTNFFDSDSLYMAKFSAINSVRFNLWLHFPVHDNIEQKYINSVKHKIKYPEANGNLVIKVSCEYDLHYEEILI